jgi:hypothetical protein
MIEYFCLKCNLVFVAGNKTTVCSCGGELELFSPEKHGRRLVGLSNSWISVWETWKDNPIFKKVSDEVAANGNYGAATHINRFIRTLLINSEQQ